MPAAWPERIVRNGLAAFLLKNHENKTSLD